jgi:hypothetical protein
MHSGRGDLVCTVMPGVKIRSHDASRQEPAAVFARKRIVKWDLRHDRRAENSGDLYLRLLAITPSASGGAMAPSPANFAVNLSEQQWH